MQYYEFITPEVGERMRILMKEKNIRTADMADILGLSESHFNKLLRADGGFKGIYLDRMAKELKVSVDYLLTGKDKVIVADKEALFEERLINDVDILLEMERSDFKRHLGMVLSKVLEKIS